MDVYEVAPYGSTTLDPAVLYDTVSEEPVMNVVQTLITYAGSSTTQYVPELATCVAGTAACTSLYGSDLIVNNGTTGAPEYYTYVIGPSHFYDGATGASWQVYPSDVLYSVARSEVWSEYPSVGTTGGWDTAQTLLPNGNPNWDLYQGSPLHYPYNNTPQSVFLDAMFVNDSTYCPASAMNGVTSFGCITFNVNGGGESWPFFTEALTQVFSGVAVVPCGLYSYLSGEKLGFSYSAASGDGPCLLPGGATSSTASSFISAVGAMSPTAWDPVEELMTGAAPAGYPHPEPSFLNYVAGSGPYYLVSSLGTIGYHLKASPGYVNNPNCAALGLPGCQPAPGNYTANVFVYWEPSDTVGAQEIAAGQADIITMYSTDTATLLQMVAQGKAQYESFPTLSIFFWTYTLDFNPSNMLAILPSGDTFNIPPYFFASVAARQTFVDAWPYMAYNNTIDTIDGVSWGVNYGGAIPNHMANYYPTNVTFPYNNPNVVNENNNLNPNIQGSAAWWWKEGTTVGTPFYNATLAACLTTTCVYPIFGQLGAPFLDEGISLWITEIEAITGGHVQPYSFDLSFTQEVIWSVSEPPGQMPMDFYTLGWIPDYPDPSNNVAAFVLANETYTHSSALWQTLNDGFYTSSTCNLTGQAITTMAALDYWGNSSGQLSSSYGQIPDDCQGWAYDTLNYWAGAVTVYESNITQRVWQYNLESRIFNELGLYIGVYQANQVYVDAKWVNQASINTNVMMGGGADQYWSAITMKPVAYTATFTESGLSSGTSWSVLFAGQKLTSSSSTITASVVPGAYNYTILLVPGYAVTSTISSVLTVSTSAPTTSVTFSPVSPHTYPVYILQSGLLPGTPYTVSIVGAGGVFVQQDNLTIGLPAGSYTYTASLPATYRAVSALSGSVTVGGSATISVTYQGITFVTIPVTLAMGSSSAVASGFTLYATGYQSAIWPQYAPGANVTVWETNNTAMSYMADTINLGVPGLLTIPTIGSATVTGTPASGPTLFVNLTNASITAKVAFSASGIPANASWYLSVNGYNSTLSPGVVSTFVIPVASYMYTAWSPGYLVVNGAFTAGGSPNSFAITFVTPPVSTTTTTTSVPGWAYAVIGLLAALAVIFIVLAAVYARRKPPSPTPPQSWEPEQPTTTPPGGTQGPGGPGGGSGGT